MKLLIDTNIILDAMMNREPWAQSAREVMLAVAEERAEGCITASTLTDIYYILNKHVRDSTQTKQILRDLLAVVTLLDVTGVDCERALDLPMSDFEDALLAACGKRHKVDCIVTRNVRHFDYSPVGAVTVEDALSCL